MPPAQNVALPCLECYDVMHDQIAFCWDCEMQICLACDSKVDGSSSSKHYGHLRSRELITNAGGVYKIKPKMGDSLKTTLTLALERFSSRPWIAVWGVLEPASRLPELAFPSKSSSDGSSSGNAAPQPCFPNARCNFTWYTYGYIAKRARFFREGLNTWG